MRRSFFLAVSIGGVLAAAAACGGKSSTMAPLPSSAGAVGGQGGGAGACSDGCAGATAGSSIAGASGATSGGAGRSTAGSGGGCLGQPVSTCVDPSTCAPIAFVCANGSWTCPGRTSSCMANDGGTSGGGASGTGGRDAGTGADAAMDDGGPIDGNEGGDATSGDATTDVTVDALDAADAWMDAADDGSDVLDGAQDGGPCNVVVTEEPLAPGIHVAVCTYIDYPTNPPSSGEHYPYPADYESYTSPVPRGFWVHDMEHGAVVFSYHCPGGCPADVAAAQAVIDAFPDDPICTGMPPGTKRVLMTPDPHLDVPWAAAAWGWTLRATCFDPQAFSDFLNAHYGQGPEVTCWQAIDPTDPDAGLPPGCGEPGFGGDAGNDSG